MAVLKRESYPINSSHDVVSVRQKVREWAVEAGFSLVDQTKLVTAASELARNIINYAGNGTMTLEYVNNATRTGLRVTFEDRGPGISDIETAMKDGYTTGGGLGLGLGGAKRLANEFEIESTPEQGTRVSITRWR